MNSVRDVNFPEAFDCADCQLSDSFLADSEVPSDFGERLFPTIVSQAKSCGYDLPLPIGKFAEESFDPLLSGEMKPFYFFGRSAD